MILKFSVFFERPAEQPGQNLSVKSWLPFGHSDLRQGWVHYTLAMRPQTDVSLEDRDIQRPFGSSQGLSTC